MKTENFKKLKELMDQVQIDADKALEKNVVSRARAARKALSEISKLCKEARKDLLPIVSKKEKE